MGLVSDDVLDGQADPELRSAGGLRDWRWPAVIAAGVIAINVWWVHVHRRWGLFDLDEAGYVMTADRLGRQRDLGSFWDALQEGFQGPLQALLAAPLHWVVGSDPEVVLWQSTVLLAVTALVCFALGRELADTRAGVVCALLVVCADGLLDYSRTAHTVMAATATAAAAMGALVASRGLRRPRWCLVFGVAVGAMVIGRSMTIAFLPPLAVAAGGWAFAARTPRMVAVRNAGLAIVAALVVGGWWWAARGPEVIDYLTGPGLNTNTGEDQASPPVMVVRQAALVIWSLGSVALVMIIAWAVLRRRDRRNPCPSPDPSLREGVPLWPLWAAMAVGLVALSPSSVVGSGFAFPFIPWLAVALVVGARRTLSDRRWRTWATALGVVAVLSAANRTVLGMDANAVWCRGAPPIKQLQTWDEEWICDVDGSASAGWQARIDAVADRARGAETDLTRAGRPSRIVYVGRDQLVNVNSVSVSGERRHGWLALDATEVASAGSDEATVEAVLDGADVLVIVPDRPPVELAVDAPEPSAVGSAARAAGFVACGEVSLPDQRVVDVVVRAPRPATGCEPAGGAQA